MLCTGHRLTEGRCRGPALSPPAAAACWAAGPCPPATAAAAAAAHLPTRQLCPVSAPHGQGEEAPARGEAASGPPDWTRSDPSPRRVRPGRARGPGSRRARPPRGLSSAPPPHRSSLLCLPPTAPRPRAPGCRRLPFLETPERPPRGWPRSVLFICCFNLLSFFSVQGRGSSSAVLPSVCLSVCTSWAGWGLGPGARWMAPSGCGGCQWMQCPASYCKL